MDLGERENKHAEVNLTFVAFQWPTETLNRDCREQEMENKCIRAFQVSIWVCQHDACVFILYRIPAYASVHASVCVYVRVTFVCLSGSVIMLSPCEAVCISCCGSLFLAYFGRGELRAIRVYG